MLSTPVCSRCSLLVTVLGRRVLRGVRRANIHREYFDWR